jgi:hypothetical protein
VNIYAALAETTPQAVLDTHAGSLFGHFKVALRSGGGKLAPISAEMSRLMDDPAEIDRILHRGADPRAREITVPILEQTYDIVGHAAQLNNRTRRICANFCAHSHMLALACSLDFYNRRLYGSHSANSQTEGS